jgi:hypothetical protein
MRTIRRGVFMCKGHQGKERAYVQALRDAGWASTESIHGALRFALFDLDTGRGGVGYHRNLPRLHQRKIPIFLYPHAARPMIQWDGMYEPFPHTRCSFVIAPGHAQVMRSYGYPLPVAVTGWTYCPIVPFQPVQQVQNILFGPIHPNANLWLSDVDKSLNQRTFYRLLEYCKATGVSLTVRHVRDLGANGLVKVDGVTYIDAQPNGATTEIDQADLVVGHQTFAYLAVARGKPVLMMGEDIPPRSGNAEDNFRWVASWEKYADLLMFPLDILAGDTAEMIERATRSDEEIREWRDRFIGQPFDGPAFVEKLEKYL